MTDYLIGVDLGGTNLRAALLDRDLELHRREQIPTRKQHGKGAIIADMIAMIRTMIDLAPGDQVLGVGVSIPGPTNPYTGMVVAPPNLSDDFKDVPLQAILEAELSLPVYLGNDANVAVLAETARGASRGYRHVIYLTWSTGIGSGMIIDGRLLLGKEGLAAEAGHMVIVNADGQFSTLEKEAAGPSMARHAARRLAAGEESALRAMAGGDLSLIDGKLLGLAAAAGDPLALSVATYGAQMMGCGITTLLHLFNPEIIVIGGGVSKMGDILFNPMWEAIRATAIDDAYWRNLTITRAALGDNASLVGAGALVVTQGGQVDVNAVVRALDG